MTSGMVGRGLERWVAALRPIFLARGILPCERYLVAGYTGAVPAPDLIPEAGAPVVAHAMIDAGVDANYENAGWGWDNPGRGELRKMVCSIFMAMKIDAPS